MRRLEPITRIGFLRVEPDEFASAASFLGVRPVALVRQKILERRKQKGAELSALAVRFRQGVFLLQMKTESLHQIFGVLFPVAAPPHISVERIPIDLEKGGQRFLRPGGTIFVRTSENHRPMGGIEIRRAAPVFDGLHAAK